MRFTTSNDIRSISFINYDCNKSTHLRSNANAKLVEQHITASVSLLLTYYEILSCTVQMTWVWQFWQSMTTCRHETFIHVLRLLGWIRSLHTTTELTHSSILNLNPLYNLHIIVRATRLNRFHWDFIYLATLWQHARCTMICISHKHAKRDLINWVINYHPLRTSTSILSSCSSINWLIDW